MKSLPNPFLGAPNLNISPLAQPGPVQVVEGDQPKQKVSKGIAAGTRGTHIVVILDESSSMSSAQGSTISGFNEYMDGQRADIEDDDNTWITAVKFNGSHVWNLWSGVDIVELPELDRTTYSPAGMTNLLDAIGTTIENVDASLRSSHKRSRPSVLFVIFTDGAENASKEFNKEAIKQMVKNREAKDWAFTFFGANIDAFEAGSSFGMSAANTMQYDVSSMGATFSAASASTTRYRGMKKSGLTTEEVYTVGMFTDDERDKSTGGTGE